MKGNLYIGRPRPQNHITSEETWALVNPVNKQLVKDFIEYSDASNKSNKTCHVYENGLKILMTWILEHANNISFTELKKKDYVKYNSYLINELKSSPNRIALMKSVVSEVANKSQAIVDYNIIIGKIDDQTEEQ